MALEQDRNPRGRTSPSRRTHAASSARRSASSLLGKAKELAGEVLKPSSVDEANGGDDTAGAIKGALFLLVVILVYLIFLTVTGQMADIIDALSHIKAGWVVAAMLVWGVYYLFGVAAYAVGVWFDRDSPVGIRDLMSVVASSIFFGNLTPGAAGAAPAEILRLTRTGLDTKEAFATQFTKFLSLQGAQVAFMTVALAIGLPVYYSTHGPIIFLDVLCYLGNILQFLLPLAVCLNPTLVMRAGNSLIKFFSTRGWLKNYARWYDLVNRQVQEFADAFRSMRDHPQGVFAIFAFLVAQQVVLCSIPWFVLKAFGLSAPLPVCILAGAMVLMFSSAVPLPGGTGGAEAGFALFFGELFGPLASAGFIVWRVVTYFLPTLITPTMLGLRSSNPESLYQRWNTLTRGGRRPASEGDRWSR